MKAKIAVIVLVIFLLSTLGIAAQQADAGPVGQQRDLRARIGPERPGSVTPRAEAVAVCRDYLTKNVPDVNNSDEVCQKILVGVKDCIDYMQDVKPAMARQMCGRLVVYSKIKPILTGKAAENIASYRLRRLQSVTETEPDAEDVIANLSEESAKVFMHLGRGQQLALLNMNHTKMMERLKDFKLENVKKANMFGKRLIASNVLKNLEHKYEMADRDYNKSRENSTLEWKEFQEAKRARNEEKTFLHAKNYLLHTTELLIKSMERLRTKVEMNERYSEEEADKIIAEIDSVIKQLEDVKTEIEGAKTKEELKSAAQSLRELWHKENVRYKRHVLQLEYSRTGEIIERASQLENRFDCAISAMESQGINSTPVELLIKEFSIQVEQARENHRLSNDYLAQAKELREEGKIKETTEALSHGRNLLKDSQKDLQEAHNILKRIVREIKASGGDVGACEENDTNVAEDEETIVVDTSEED